MGNHCLRDGTRDSRELLKAPQGASERSGWNYVSCQLFPIPLPSHQAQNQAREAAAGFSGACLPHEHAHTSPGRPQSWENQEDTWASPGNSQECEGREGGVIVPLGFGESVTEREVALSNIFPKKP